MKTVVSAAALAACLLSNTAFAQSEDAAPDSEALIVTGTRAAQPIAVDRFGGSVTVLDDRTLEERQTRQIADVLRDVPGVAVSAVAGQTQIRIRGAEANHVLVLIDGIEVSDPYSGEFDFGSLAADSAARVEVLRGQQSALYGSDAIGGVVHYITLDGREAPGIRLRAEGGSFGTFNAAARAAGSSGAFDYALSATRLETDGAPGTRGGSRNLGRTSNALSAKLGWNATDTLRLHAVGRYARTVADFNDQDFDPTSPTFGYAVDSPGSFVRNRGLYALIGGELALLDGRWTHGLSAQIADTKRDGFGAAKPSYGDRGSRLKGSYATTLTATTGAASHALTFAFDAERERFRNADPSGYGFNGWRRTDNLGFVGQYSLSMGALAIGGSVRHDSNTRFADTDTYRVQGSYALPFGLRLRAAAGSGVKNPNATELFGYVDGKYIGNPNLKPERSEGWEAGAEQSLWGDQVTVGATYFESVLRNEIYTSYPAPLFVATPANRATESRQHGVEAFARARIGDAWRIDLAYTHLKARENGVREVRRPDDIASASLAWRAPGNRGGLSFTVRHTGQQTDFAYTDPSFVPVTVRLDSYTLGQIAGDWDLGGGFGLFGRIENAFDSKYEQVFSFTNPGTSATAGIRARF